MSPSTTSTAGLDTGKHHLDLALPGGRAERLPNTPEGHALVLERLRGAGVGLVGIEATGGYERGVVAALREGGVRVRVLQPAQVRAFAQLTLQRAKTDALDAALIRDCTALLPEPRGLHPLKPDDPGLRPLADALTLVEQVTETIALWRQRRERAGPAQKAYIADEIARLTRERTRLLRELKALVRAQPALAERFALALSVPGLGEITALTLVIRMPELGSLSREEAASLAGLAPFDDASGARNGPRRIAGGRARVRRALFCAAMPASARWNPALVALRQRLAQAGKPFNAIIVACARKLLIQLNAVLARHTPWQPQTQTPC